MEAALAEAVERHGGAIDDITPIVERAQDDEVRQWALDANLKPPRLVDDHHVEFDPAWHRLLDTAIGFGLHGAPWAASGPAPHLTRAAGFYVWSQVEAGHGCPISMTYAAIPSLRLEPELAEQWNPRLTSTTAPALAGMTMTEKQGGSDLRAVTTRAEPAAEGTYVLTGEKWFCSAPTCDVFLALARTDAGPTCFLLPRLRPDGTANALRVVRLKSKLGNRSNASAQIALDGALAWRVGPEGRGLA
ncbi:MAG TPA: acyl-CoA dehydrogenase family protein, partial [Actinopolymorphaceae bacterium]